MHLALPERRLTWLFTGASVMQGCLHTRPQRNHVEIINEHVRWDLGRSTDVLINTGVSGWSIEQLLADWDYYVGRFEPDIAALLIGVNNVLQGPAALPTYKRAMQEAITRLRDGGAQVIVEVPPTLRCQPGELTHAPDFFDAMREVASRNDALLIDHDRDWSESTPPADLDTLLSDDLHPNAAGHERMARLFLTQLGLDRLEPKTNN